MTKDTLEELIEKVKPVFKVISKENETHFWCKRCPNGYYLEHGKPQVLRERAILSHAEKHLR